MTDYPPDPRPTTPSSPEVPGFAEAASDGLAPVIVPATPPPLLVRPSAGTYRRLQFTIMGSLTAAINLGVLWLVAVKGADDESSVLSLIGNLLLPVGLLFGALWAWLNAGLARRQAEELRHGYTTLPVEKPLLGARSTSDVSWMAAAFGQKGEPVEEPVDDWDDSAIWRLHPRTGAVIHAPSGVATPPGMHPSPVKPGVVQRWNVRAWLSYLRARRHPRNGP